VATKLALEDTIAELPQDKREDTLGFFKREYVTPVSKVAVVSEPPMIKSSEFFVISVLVMPVSSL
jgi:hypothetical protein